MNKKIVKFAIIGSAAIGAFAVASVLVVSGIRHFLIEDSEILAHSVAQSILPALLVNDTQQVESMLKALESYPGIESAELLSAEGASIASYARAGHELDSMSGAFELASASDDPNQVHVMAPITFDSLIVGNLHIAVNLWPAYMRLMTWLGILLIVPSAIYVFIKQFRIKLRFEKVHSGEGSSGGGGALFDVEHAVSAAMSDADITLEYQPIQRMSDGGLFGMEVVVCWRHPSGQTVHVSPSNFVALAEKNNICLPFDDWLLTTACKQAAGWQHQYGPLVLSINISATQFKNPAFAQKVRDVCARTQYPHQLLELEVNESVLTHSPQLGVARIQAFAEQGLSMTVDQFGLSQSSLDLLAVLPVHKVKLDRKLIKRLGRDDQVEHLVIETINQALSHDVQVMAEGLEFAAQRMALQRVGCILGQGSHFSAPMKASAFQLYLATRPFDVLNSQMHRGNLQPSGWRDFSAAT